MSRALVAVALAASLCCVTSMTIACPAGGPVVTEPAPPPVWEEITMELSVSHVPHAAESCGTNCLSCHATGENGAPPQAHPERTECMLCHIVVDPSDQ